MADSVRSLPSWVKAYLAFTYSNEAPEEYHTWAALSTIAGALRRKCYFDMGYFKLYPNLYVILVGPPGRCKKSTAMRISREMMTDIPGINFTADSTSRERLIQDLTQSTIDGHSSMTAFSSEFASLLTTSGMDMVVFLTDIYESPNRWSHRTKMGGTQNITGPYLNLFGGTTPDWIARSLPLDTVGIGLTSRIIFVYQDTPRIRPAFPSLTPEQVAIGELLRNDLAVISNIQGEYVMEKTAREAYSAWYESRIQNPNPTGDSRLSGYFERKPMHVLKVAMNVAASKRDALIITQEDLDDTMTLLAQTEERMPKVFAAVGKNTLAYDMSMILEVVEAAAKANGGVTLSTLHEMVKHNVRLEEFDEIISTLQRIGRVDVLVKPGGERIVTLKRN